MQDGRPALMILVIHERSTVSMAYRNQGSNATAIACILVWTTLP
jgi:hypothetical protein